MSLADHVLDNSHLSIEQTADRIIDMLKEEGLLPSVSA
jgi:hypothetical protein